MKEYIIELSSDDENALSIITKAYNLHELIRCKDCKYRSDKMYDYYGNPNNKVYVCQINDLAKKTDWYCADSKRRDEADE